MAISTVTRSPEIGRLAAIPGLERLCYIVHILKSVEWFGNSKAELAGFPKPVQQDIGYQLFKVQCGREPNDWKPMASIGAGVQELRIREASGAFRVIYLATRKEAVYVLHCFQKKSQKTSKRNIELAKKRYDEVTR